MARKKTDLEQAVEELSAKDLAYSKLWRYYDGEPPLIYSTEKLREIFESIQVRFSENWASVIVDALIDRLSLEKPSIMNNDALSKQLSEWWEESGAWLEEVSVYEDLIITGEAFLIVWPDEDDEELVSIYHNDSRQVYMRYDADSPRKKKYAAKWWKGEDEKAYLNLYYPERIEYYSSESEESSVASKYTLDRTEDNPYGKIPVFHFRPTHRTSRSQIKPVTEQLDLINKLMNDLAITSEFMAAPQRYVITQADLSQLRNSPSEIWRLPPSSPGDQPTSVGEFSPANLTSYLSVMAQLAGNVASISRTPRHYFFGGEAPSGEALRVLEAPLIAKARRMTDLGLVPVWKEIVQFLLELHDQDVKKADIEVVYQPFETDLPVLEAGIRSQSVQAGIPLQTVLRSFEGWTDEDLEEMAKDRQEEQVAQATYAEAMMQAAGTKFDQGTPE